MTAFLPGDVVIGAAHGYAEHIRPSGTYVQHLPAQDDFGNGLTVWGATWAPNGRLYMACGPEGPLAIDYAPHDVCWIPTGGLAVLIARLDATAELWRYDADGVFVESWTIDTDAGWAGEPMKLDVACDGKTVYYTDQGLTIFKFDMETGLNLTPFLVLDGASPYKCGAFKLLPDPPGGLMINMTGIDGGNGPQRALCLDRDGLNVWTDEINPAGSFDVFKRARADGSDALSVEVDTAPASGVQNDYATALACYLQICPFGQEKITISGLM